jgi:hypothetical protein
VTARHHGDSEDKEHEKEEHQEQGDHVVPASLLLSLTRPQMCLTAHCVPFRNGKREGRATPGTRGHSRAAPRYHGAFPRTAAQSRTKRASGLIRPMRFHRGSGRRDIQGWLIALRSALGYQDGHGHCSDLTAWPAHRKGDAGWLGDEDSAGIAGVLLAAGWQFDLPWRRTDGIAV